MRFDAELRINILICILKMFKTLMDKYRVQHLLIAARSSVEMSPHKSALDILSLLKHCKNNSVSSSLIKTFVTAVQHFTQFPSVQST